MRGNQLHLMRVGIPGRMPQVIRMAVGAPIPMSLNTGLLWKPISVGILILMSGFITRTGSVMTTESKTSNFGTPRKRTPLESEQMTTTVTDVAVSSKSSNCRQP